ncbi:MAG TPA: YkvA family protein [Pyrinomonadaceae bacterium]|nr:YkvA family protein [Pyrinomonadaceae bacterium]
MSNFLMFLPNMVVLLGRLLKDARVPSAEKALFLGAIVYVISPIDLIPDIFPFIGQVDDIYMVALTLLRLVNRTDENVVREHWRGGGDVVALADSIARIAPILLPKRVSRVISSKVEMSSAGKVLGNIGQKKEPLLVEVEEPVMTNGTRVQTAPPMSN